MDIILETDKGSGHPILHSVPTGHGERHSFSEQRLLHYDKWTNKKSGLLPS